MTRYFFHIRDDEALIKDEEGTDLPSLESARQEAVISAREIIAESLKSAEPWDHMTVEIWDDNGIVEVVKVATILGPKDTPLH